MSNLPWSLLWDSKVSRVCISEWADGWLFREFSGSRWLNLHKPGIIKQAAADIFEMHDNGQIRPAITETYPLDEFQTTLRQFGEKKSIGKIVMTTGRD